jgi:hypothetical protein
VIEWTIVAFSTMDMDRCPLFSKVTKQWINFQFNYSAPNNISEKSGSKIIIRKMFARGLSYRLTVP